MFDHKRDIKVFSWIWQYVWPSARAIMQSSYYWQWNLAYDSANKL